MNREYIEYNGRIAFHPGYYIREIVDDSGLSHADFAKRLDTTPKNLSILIRGEQSLSPDMAMKLARMLDTSIDYWMNLQASYDSIVAGIESDKELEKEKRILSILDYRYFRDNFALPDHPRRWKEQVVELRRFLDVASLTVLEKPDMAVSFRSSSKGLNEESIIKANAMVQIAVNLSLSEEAPKFNRRKLEMAVRQSLELTSEYGSFHPSIRRLFREAGVKLMALPNIPGSRINGAAKKVGDCIMLMVNDRHGYLDTFWFTLMHEVGHIMNGDLGASFDEEAGDEEIKANAFAQDVLIPSAEYRRFLEAGRFDRNSIMQFSKAIGREPSILLGRLMNDGYVGFSDGSVRNLRRRFRVGL